uniref:GT23 domain-containing protein n=1 Tax=Meloidogyne floridensis TaxID=298350 RepID=A0A915NLG5_9BILA
MVKRGFDVSPTELKTFLLKYHSNPTLWFRGQLIKYIWKENELTLNATNQSVSRIPFECGKKNFVKLTERLMSTLTGPVVGIHVRRTDKISEAKFFNLEEYMVRASLTLYTWIDFWFDVVWGHNHSESIHPNCTNRRMLFIASDLPILKDIVEETKNKWGDRYEVYHGIFNTQNDSKEAFTEILAVFRILAKCQFIVCTFSSNACQLVYELMQEYQGDAVENIHSLDYIYEMSSRYILIYLEHPIMPEELWAEKGDVIEALSPIHQDGFIRAKNYRLKKVGSFPMYLLKKHLKFENFSIFANIQ